jgi:N-methylhydantoinase A/acetophenone carboxylase
MMNSIDIDTGGTFTDGVFRHDGRVVTVKVDTTPHDPVKCFMECIAHGAAKLGIERSELLHGTDILRYATTAATNAIVQMKGPKIGLVISEGMDCAGIDEQRLGESSGADGLRRFIDPSMVERVSEAVDEQGVMQTALDEESFRQAVERLLDAGARLLVVALEHADINPVNELRAKEAFEAALPSFYLGRPFMLLSHQVSATGDAMQRLNSAVISGYLHRELVGYLYRCDDAVRRLGYRHPLLVVHSTGGASRVAKTKALNTYNSGPTAGVFGAARIARRYGLPHVMTMDIGGTSTDVAFVEAGRLQLQFDAEIEGVSVSVPMIDVVGLGGGGGSMALVEERRLRVGPESAGAVPGPVCYDLGNGTPTVTDANAVLGLIAADNFLGGRRRMNIERAEQSIGQHIANPLGLSVDAAALEIRSVLAENLAASIRAEAGKRGFPLSEAVVFAYGGAGPLHAADIAAAAGIDTFYMFPESPVFSAAGTATMDIRHFYECRVQPLEGEQAAEALQRAASGLSERARRDMRGEGFDPDAATLRFSLESPRGSLTDLTPAQLDRLETDGDRHGLLRLTATLGVPGQDGQMHDSGIRPVASLATGSEREVCFAGGRRRCAVYAYHELSAGQHVNGPALVESSETTAVIPPGWLAEIDQYGALKAWRQ